MSETAPEPEEAVVSTAGVCSHVFDSDESDVLGHALLLDLDNSSLLEAVNVADDLEMIAAVLRSSEGSHHVWGLGVDSLREQTTRSISYYAADDSHVGASWRRGYAVLRLVGKIDSEGATYKSRPSVEHVSLAGAEGDHSAAHAAMLRSLIEDQEAWVAGAADALEPAEAPESVSYVGDETDLRVDNYQTLTDDGKEALRGGGA